MSRCPDPSWADEWEADNISVVSRSLDASDADAEAAQARRRGRNELPVRRRTPFYVKRDGDQTRVNAKL